MNLSCEWFVSRDLFTQSLYTFLSVCTCVMCSCIFLAASNFSSSETASKTLCRSFSHVAHTSSLGLAILICGRHWFQMLQNVEYCTCRSFGAFNIFLVDVLLRCIGWNVYGRSVVSSPCGSRLW